MAAALEQFTIPRYAVATSTALRRIRHLNRLLGVERVVSARDARALDPRDGVVLAWGRKPSAAKAVVLAAKTGRVVWYLEDGFIRSASRDAHGALSYSLLVDPVGVYYDSSEPSGLEQFLNRDEPALHEAIGAEALADAARWRQCLIDNDITKYNYCATPDIPQDARPLVLVIDQTRDDASVRCGGMDEHGFERMLDAAISENPGARVLVRTHPDVVAGRRQGYLDRLALSRGIELSGAGDNPIPWLRAAQRVYAATSQLGYEALLCNRPVTVFGRPFYAGWGLTDDRQHIQRRRHTRTVDELFHATHVHFARYVSPVTGELWTLEQCLAHVCLQKRTFARNARQFQCAGITPWKRRYVRQYLRSPDGSVRFGVDDTADASRITRLCWGYRQLPALWKESGAPLWRMEDGFLRSAGLGSDFTAPGSLVVDERGLYLDPESGSDLEELLNTHECSVDDLKRARRLRERLLVLGLSKYNLSGSLSRSLQPESCQRTRVLVVGQVEDDASVLRGTREVNTNALLIAAARKSCPDAWIIYRPHPDVAAGNRQGAVDIDTMTACVDEMDSGMPIHVAIAACDQLHTMTSLSGFEALLRGKQVVTWGAPFYAGWGLTEDGMRLTHRTRSRTLDELVYLALLHYPRYLDIDSGEFIEAESLVDIIERKLSCRDEATRPDPLPRQLMRLNNLAKGLTYAR